VLVGCGPDTTPVVTEPPTEEQPTDEPEATEEPAPPTAAPLEGEITTTAITGAMTDWMRVKADEFEALHPGVTVNVVENPPGGQLEAQIAAGNPPDINVASFGYMAAKYAAMDVLVPLEDLPGGAELFANLEPSTLYRYYGHYYYVPAGIDLTVMIYNKALFEEAGLDPEDPPETFAEFLAAAEAISALPPREDGSPVYGTVFWNDALAWGGWYWNMLGPIYFNINGGQYRIMNSIGTDVEFDNPDAGMTEFFQFVKDAQQYAPPVMDPNFFSRKVGMWPQYGYSWLPNLQTAEGEPMVIGEDVGVAHIPVPEAGMTHYTTLGGRPYMIFQSTPEREMLAWEFVKFLMTEENSLSFCTELNYLPTLLTLKDDPYFTSPERQLFVEASENALFPEAFANYDEVANELLKAYVQVVIDETLTPEEGVAAAALAAREILGIAPAEE
jgi:multiple sugar transport system substrate-binding protein